MITLGELNKAAETMTDTAPYAGYVERHGIVAQPFLTVHDDEAASATAEYLAPRIEGKTVVEIGGGLGLAALHIGLYAKRVYVIEANPIWANAFVAMLFSHKPKNVSYLFGSADEFSDVIKADVALFMTHSGVDDMTKQAALFAPQVIDVYGELIAGNPNAFDPLASLLRTVT